jgi:sugar/nucleoside kinase (ribokinase family)
VAELEGHRIEVHAERSAGFHTAKNLALVVRGEDRRFHAELSANAMLSPGHVLRVIEETRPRAFYQGTVGGMRLIDGRLDEVLGGARRLGCVTAVDVVIPHKGGWRRIEEILPLADIFHCNDREGSALTGEDDPLVASERILHKSVGLCLITMGPGGLVAANGETRLRMPAFKVDAVDPTGVRDAFCAGVIGAILDSGMDREGLARAPRDTLRNILLDGAAAGAACVSAPGATTAVSREAVDGLIAEQGDLVWKGAESL